MGDQQSSLFHGQPFECVVEGPRRGDRSIRRLVASRHGVVVGIYGDLAHGSPVAQRHAAGVRRDPPQPGGEPFRFTKTWQAAPGSDERFLGGVLGVGSVAEDGVCGSVHGVDLLPDEHLEGIAIACLSTLDERPLHGPSRGCPT